MTLVRYKADHKGTGELLVTPEMHDLVRHAVDAAKEYAVVISPDQEPYSEGYIASFETEVGLERRVVGDSPRATAILRNTSEHASAVEWRWDHHVLARTAAYLEDAWFPRG